MRRLNKRGEEYVEAAIVMPLLILTILSMIMIAVFLFRHLESKSEAHIALMHEAASADDIFAVKSRGVSSSSFIKGTFDGAVSKNDHIRAYALKQAEVIRLGRSVF